MELDGIKAPAPKAEPEAQPEPVEQPEVKGKLIDFDDNEWGTDSRIVEPGDETTPEEGPEETEPEEEPVVEEVAPIESNIVEVGDPGEFVPSDYSFDVTVYDAEGKNARTVNIQSPEQWDNLLATDPTFDPAALSKAHRSASRMEIGQERDKADWTKQKEAYDQYSQEVSGKTQALETMASEIEYLVNKGDLPKVDAKYKEASWSDPEVAKQPGVKEQVALLNYMRRENSARTKAGLKPMTSILDAFNAFQIDNARKRNVETKKTAGVQRKEAGSRIAGTTPNPISIAPKGIAVGRAGSLNSLTDTDWSV